MLLKVGLLSNSSGYCTPGFRAPELADALLITRRGAEARSVEAWAVGVTALLFLCWKNYCVAEVEGQAKGDRGLRQDSVLSQLVCEARPAWPHRLAVSVGGAMVVEDCCVLLCVAQLLSLEQSVLIEAMM